MEKTAKKAGFTVAAMILATLLSKLLGMLRQVMIASTLADSMEGVAFAAASKIPFAIFDMLFSAAVLGSFIPIYKGSLAKEPERARKFSASFLTCICRRLSARFPTSSSSAISFCSAMYRARPPHTGLPRLISCHGRCSFSPSRCPS